MGKWWIDRWAEKQYRQAVKKAEKWAAKAYYNYKGQWKDKKDDDNYKGQWKKEAWTKNYKAVKRTAKTYNNYKGQKKEEDSAESVSYTHLTLPTIYSV